MCYRNHTITYSISDHNNYFALLFVEPNVKKWWSDTRNRCHAKSEVPFACICVIVFFLRDKPLIKNIHPVLRRTLKTCILGTLGNPRFRRINCGSHKVLSRVRFEFTILSDRLTNRPTVQSNSYQLATL